jgi:hypothetical protein
MRVSRILAFILPGLLVASPQIQAQTAARVVTTGGVHTVVFTIPQGTVSVHVPSDAAPGDSISGAVVTEAAGAGPQDRDANLRRLNGLMLEFQEQRAPVSSGRYEWSVPNALRAGSGALLLREADGRMVAQSSIPIDPVPVPQPRAGASTDFEVPTEGEAGKTAVIRGRTNRELTSHTVTLGATNAELLAVSPRQLAFRVPATVVGAVPVRFTVGERVINRTLRVFNVRLVATQSQLFRGQRAELTVTVSGLTGITEPVLLTIVNQSVANVQIEGIERPVAISPGQVIRGGTFVVKRRMTGVQPGPFRLSASAGRAPLAQFDAVRSSATILDNWQARTGVSITADAGDLVLRSVVDARKALDDFLSQQQANQGDVREVFAALLSHYCFDLRDDGIARRRAEFRPSIGFGVQPVLFRQAGSQGQGDAGITSNQVQRLSLSDVVSRLTSRFAARQAAGYLFVRSMPRQAAITIDGQVGGELTDRRLVTPVGDHDVVVRTPQTCRQRVTVSAFRTEVVECAQ